MARIQVVTDNFNRAALGADWAQLNPAWGDMAISGSTVVRGPTATDNTIAQAARYVGSSAGSITSDQYAAIQYVTYGGVAASDYGLGVVCRASTDQDGARDFYYFIVRDDGTAVLGKQVNGTHTTLNNGAVSWASGDIVALEVEGTTLRACKNTTPLGGAWTLTDSSLSGGGVGIAGMGAIDGDNFDAGNLGSSFIARRTLLGVG